jgi:hypothetical protein
MVRLRLAVRYTLVLAVLALPGASTAEDEAAVRAQAVRFYSSLANGQFGTAWELLSRNVARDISREDYVRGLAAFFEGTKLTFEVGPARKPAGERVELTSNLRLVRESEHIAYPVRHTSIWAYDKERNGWFFDGERGQPLVATPVPK